MATRKPSTPKTSTELKQQLAQAKERLAELEKRAYAEEINELISATNMVADFAAIQKRVSDIDATVILAATVAEGSQRLFSCFLDLLGVALATQVRSDVFQSGQQFGAVHAQGDHGGQYVNDGEVQQA